MSALTKTNFLFFKQVEKYVGKVREPYPNAIYERIEANVKNLLARLL